MSNNKSDIQLETSSQRIVCLGVMTPSKGYEYALKAMRTVIKKHPRSSLLIAGPTIAEEGKDYIKRLRLLASEYSLDDNVIIEERYLSDHEFSEEIRSAGVVVLPYKRSVSASSLMSLAVTYKVPIVLANSGPWFGQLSDLFPNTPKLDHDILAQNIIKILDSEAFTNDLVERYRAYFSENDWC